MSEDKSKAPKETGLEKGREAISPLVALGALCGLDAGVTAIASGLGSVINVLCNRKSSKWQEEVYDGLTDLRADVTYSQSEEFQDFLLSATIIAVRSSEQKRQYLKSALVNAAQGFDASESIKETFLHAVDQFTPIHIGMLETFVKHEAKFFNICSSVVEHSVY